MIQGTLKEPPFFLYTSYMISLWLGVAILFMLIVISVQLADDMEEWFWVVIGVAIMCILLVYGYLYLFKGETISGL